MSDLTRTCSDNISLESIRKTLKRWEGEANNFRNDGWVQEGYKNKLKEVFSQSGKALLNIKKIK